jgi:hypothetical protein
MPDAAAPERQWIDHVRADLVPYDLLEMVATGMMKDHFWPA